MYHICYEDKYDILVEINSTEYNVNINRYKELINKLDI